MIKKLISAIWISIVVFFFITTTVSAKEGFYLGLGLPYNTIDGDFKGNSVLSGHNDLIIIPDIDGAFGVGLLFGYVTHYGFAPDQLFAIEGSFLLSVHDAEFQGQRGTVDYSLVNFDLKYLFMTSKAIEPYLLIGISLADLTIENGAVSLTTGKEGDALLTGVGLNLGIGLDYYLTKNISLGTGVIYRIISYDIAEGVEDKSGIKDGFSGSGLGIILSTAYHF
ncbi:MAG: outer membrane beta-barrel protein [Nitrospirae bacterium]|nr:outer membrane beta-barrel protein [Nitrospirota bacterium]